VLRRLMAEFRAPFVPGLPRFTGGAVGFIGYDAGRCSSRRWGGLAACGRLACRRPGGSEDEAGFMLFDTVLAFDHVKHRILLIANARITPDEDLRALYQFACAKIRFPRSGNSSAALSQARAPRGRATARPLQLHRGGLRGGRAHDPGSHRRRRDLPGGAVAALRGRRQADPFTVYRALRHVNPSPYMYFIRMGRLAIVGSSPEMLVRVEGPRVETHPIAGTRPRGERRGGSAAGRGAEAQREGARRARDARGPRPQRPRPGVRVRQRAGAAVHGARALLARHAPGLAGRGRLADDRDHLDALVACFPAGTVSGAPKIRAMEVLAELEPTARGLYGGAIGYIDFAGNLDFCIAIRTITIRGDAPRPGRRRYRRRFESGRRVRRDARQGAGAAACDADGGGRPVAGARVLLLIDNYDSFTFNLAQYFGELGATPSSAGTTRSRSMTSPDLRPDRIVISPGPGRPEDAGISIEVIRRFGPERPVLGVCLGHQGIGAAFGGRIVRAPELMHGKVSQCCTTDAVSSVGCRRPLPRAAITRWSSPPAAGRPRGVGPHGGRHDHGAAAPRVPRSTACSSIPSRS
jgi:anthranilate synthase component I